MLVRYKCKCGIEVVVAKSEGVSAAWPCPSCKTPAPVVMVDGIPCGQIITSQCGCHLCGKPADAYADPDRQICWPCAIGPEGMTAAAERLAKDLA